MEDIERETTIIGDFDFIPDDDKKQLVCQKRIVDMSRCGSIISLSFELGRKEGDIMTMMLNLNELLICLGRLAI